MGIILGVTGNLGSGKDTVANYLVEKKSFLHLSLSDILREDLERMGKTITRENLQNLGNEIRSKYGGSILTERILGRMLPEKDYVISSIGRIDEVNFLRKHPKFTLIFVDANVRLRFERVKIRKNEPAPGNYKYDYKEFIKKDNLERKGGGAQFREFDNLKKIAPIVIHNNSSLEVLHKKIDKVLNDINIRPDWDDYFFGIMDAVSRRATCDRFRGAALIVKDKQILATGYVGAPAGLEHCDEVGHLMEKTLHEDGTERWHCVRTTHAEQNAIAQAAKNGTSILGAKIYIGMEPCLSCTKMIINSGIKEIIVRNLYHAGGTSRKFLKNAGIKLRVQKNIIHKAGKQLA